MNSAAIRSARTSSSTVEPVAALDLHRGRALRRASRPPGPRSAGAARSSLAARVAATVVRDPAAVVRLARSSGPRTPPARSPANTRWLWESTKPGTTVRPSSRSAGPRPGRPAPARARRSCPSSTTSAASARIPEPVRRRSPSQVTSSTDAGDQRGRHRLHPWSSQQPVEAAAVDRPEPMPAVGDDRSPPTTTRRTSAAVAA